MKVLYKPFAIIASLIGARLGRNAFKKVWAKIDETDPPDPTTAEASFGKVVGAAALEAATMAAIGAAVDRASARSFHYLTGFWPGKQREEPSEED
jgi:predicted DNA-binding transcriptional regulator YafY